MKIWKLMYEAERYQEKFYTSLPELIKRIKEIGSLGYHKMQVRETVAELGLSNYWTNQMIEEVISK